MKWVVAALTEMGVIQTLHAENASGQALEIKTSPECDFGKVFWDWS